MDIMRVTIQLPDDISAALEEQWDDVPRRSLEAIAVEAYRTGALTDSQVRRLLGFESRFQVHALLKEHHVPLQTRLQTSRTISRATRARNSAQPMIVVADSGPLHYLILLEHIELLRRSYGQVLVPEPVASELSAAGAPAVVREWITKPPTWIDVRHVPPDAVSMITDDLDLGERAAIALAQTVRADLLLIDEAAGVHRRSVDT